MDRKSIIILVACFLLLMLWPQMVKKLYPPKPLPPGMTNVVSQTRTSAAPATTITTTNAPPTATLAPLSSPLPALPTATVEEGDLIEFTNENAHYTFTPNGGGLKLVELTRYPETVSRHREKGKPQRLAALNSAAPVPVLGLLGEGLTGDGVYELAKTATGVRATKTLTNGLAIVKEFTVTTNYLVAASVRLENQSSAPLSLPAQEYVVGTATPMGPDDDGHLVGLLWYNGAKSESITEGWFANRTLGCVPGTPRPLYTGGQSNVVWAAAHNQFFTLVAMPDAPAQQVVARQIELPRPADPDPRYKSKPAPKGYVTTLVYPETTLAPGQKLERQIFLFAGPKEYRTLAKVAMRFNNNADIVMSFGWAGFVAKPLLLAMNWVNGLFKFGYGWAIIAITIIIKVVFWPLTQASTRSMKRMAALQPEMKALQAKYKDDPAKMNKKMMEFWKEHKVNPMGGCLPMLIQMPVFIGFYMMIQSAIELRGASFLWIADLSKPDTLFYIAGFPFNLLPLLMGATMLWQSHLTPPSPGMDPMQQKMMRYMPLIFLFMLYGFSSGLTLYWTVQNLLSILQMKLTKSNEPVVAGAPAVAKALPPKKWK